MAKKIDLAFIATTAVQGEQVAATLNRNMARISAAMESTFSRDGTEPNTWATDLDLNGNALVGVLVPYEARLNAPVGGHLNEDRDS